MSKNKGHHFKPDPDEQFALLKKANDDSIETYDVKINIGETKTINCHKGILIVKSEQFRETFKEHKKINQINLKEGMFELEIFKKIILQIYGIEIQISTDIKELIDYMRHLQLLKIKDLKRKIAQYCMSIVEDRNVCKIQNAAQLQDEEELQEFCQHQVLDNATNLFVTHPEIHFEVLPFINLKRLIHDDNLDIDERQLVDAIFQWLAQNSTTETNDHDRQKYELAKELQSHLSPYIRMARMEHPQLNSIFNPQTIIDKNADPDKKAPQEKKFVEFILKGTEKQLSDVFKQILEIQEQQKDGGIGKYPDSTMCRPRTDAIFKFRICSTEIQQAEDTKKPMEIRDQGQRIRRTFMYTNQSILACSDRRMMTKACFKLKVLKGGYKTADEDRTLMKEKEYYGYMGFGLCEFETLKLWPCTLPQLNSKFVAIQNMQGCVHLAQTSRDKLRKDIEFREMLEQRKQAEENKKVTNDETDDEDSGNPKAAGEVSDHSHQDQKLLNEELSDIMTNEDMRICEGDIITVQVNFSKALCTFQINKQVAFQDVDISHLGKNLHMSVWMLRPDDSVIMVEARKVSSTLEPCVKHKELNKDNQSVRDDFNRYMDTTHLMEEE